MSKLDELIQEYCPDGVEYKKVKDVFIRLRGTPITAGKMKEIANENGNIRIFAGGKTVIDADEDKIENANIIRVPAVLVQSRGIIDVIYYEKPFTFKSEMWAYTSDNKVTVKYLYYVLKNNIKKFRDSASGMGSLPQISLSVTEDFQIPLPPLPVQEEIVRILDNFTDYTAELTAELTARQNQYEYYRDKLLKCENIVPRVRLGDICSVITKGTTPKKYVDKGISFIKTESFNGTRIDLKKISYIDEFTHNTFLKRSILEENDILITIAGATIGKCLMVPKEVLPANTNQALAIIRVKKYTSCKYVMYVLQSYLMKKYIQKNIKGSAQPNLNLQQLNDFIIPLPTLETQKRIVHVLDNFEKICSDLNIGLPAEIEARQKQYEYYRDALLTFAAKGDIIVNRTEQNRTEHQYELIKLIQYVFGFVTVQLKDISENYDRYRRPVTKEKRIAGKYPYYGASGIVDYVSDYIFEGDFLLVSEDGANLIARNTPIAFSISGKNWVNNHAHVLKFHSYALRRYVEIYLNSIDLSKYISSAAQPKLSRENLDKILIKLPDQENLEHIVAVLDRFDALCNDLTCGLPAEIAARQKQYEYYRDKLLTFKEAK